MMHSNARPHLIKPQSTRSGPSNCAKQVIIGLYGLPGAGKIFWLGNLQTALGNDDFRFYDGSDAIAAVTPGGDEILTNINRLETVIMLDADKTLAQEDRSAHLGACPRCLRRGGV